MHKLHLRLLFLTLLVGGCATPRPVPVDDTPDYKIPEHIWWQVEREIVNASATSAAHADGYARKAMKKWADLIWEQTESEFIPWYANYWTQQWLFMKMAWYQLQEEDGEDNAAERMRTYLLEQLQERVLQPVAELTDPSQIAVLTASVYLESLRVSTAPIQDRHLIPEQAWRTRLERIVVIEMATHSALNASLYQLLQPGDPMKIDAYRALMEQPRSTEEEVNAGHAGSELDRVVDRAVQTLEEKAALKGSVAAASAIAGGGIGLLISVGATAWGISEHNTIKPVLETEFRDSLKSVLKQTTRRLIEDRWHGVLSLVQHMHWRLEEQLWHPGKLSPPASIPPSPYPAERYPEFDVLF